MSEFVVPTPRPAPAVAPAPERPSMIPSPKSTEVPATKSYAYKQPMIPSRPPTQPRQARSQVLRRQMVKTASKKFRPKAPQRRNLVPSLLMSLAILLFLSGAFVAISAFRTNRSVKAQVKQLAAQSQSEGGDGNIPDENGPTPDVDSYRVAPDMPRIIRIQKLGVAARILRMGVGADNALRAPGTIFDAGWYEGSAKPGENGTILIDGHVSGPTKQGVFYSIGTLKAGDKITVERGDGKVFRYSVTGSKLYDYNKVDMATMLTTSVAGKPGLNLITCGGRFNVTTNKYESRVAVFAVED